MLPILSKSGSSKTSARPDSDAHTEDNKEANDESYNAGDEHASSEEEDLVNESVISDQLSRHRTMSEVVEDHGMVSVGEAKSMEEDE